MHQHFCDFVGHYWDCPGSAIRSLLGQFEPSLCICMEHQVPMEEGDHSQCSIELLVCPEHRDAQLRKMGYEPGTSNMPQPSSGERSSMFRDEHGNRTVGFCLWCNRDFYTREEVEEHNANEMEHCPAFQELKDTGCMPPVLQVMFDAMDALDGTDGHDDKEDGKEKE